MCNPELNPEGLWVDPCSGEVLEPNYVHQSFERGDDGSRRLRPRQLAGLPQFFGPLDNGYGTDTRYKARYYDKLVEILKKLNKMNLSLCALTQASGLARILSKVVKQPSKELDAVVSVAKLMCSEDTEIDYKKISRIQRILADAGYKINIIAKRNIKPYVDWELEVLARELEKKAKIEFVTKEIHSGALFLASLILYNVEGRQRASQGEIARYYDISKETLRRHFRRLSRILGYKLVLCADMRPYLEKCPEKR
jgi:hypothetical protein